MSSIEETPLDTEIKIWSTFFHWIYENIPAVQLCCKGGSVLGLSVIQLLFEHGVKILRPLAELFVYQLIKDWDFTIVNLDKTQQAKIIQFAETLGMHNQASSFPVLRYTQGILLHNKFLFELSLKEQETIADLELPITNLKLLVDPSNIDPFFVIVKLLYHGVNFDTIHEQLNNLHPKIQIHGEQFVDDIQYGLYIINSHEKNSSADLSEELLDLMEGLGNDNIDTINAYTMKQFLISQIVQPDRLFHRFVEKNKHKSVILSGFLSRYSIPQPKWLLCGPELIELEHKINLFLIKLNNHIHRSFFTHVGMDMTNLKQNMRKFYDDMDRLFKGVNIARLTQQIAKTNADVINRLLPIHHLRMLKQLKIQEAVEHKLEKDAKLPIDVLQLRKDAPIATMIERFDYKSVLPTCNKSKYAQWLFGIMKCVE